MSDYPVLRAAQALHSIAEARNWRYCVVGGIAANRWGEPHATRNVDATVRVERGEEESFIGPLLEAFVPRVANPGEVPRSNRVLLLAGPEGDPIDVALGAFPYEHEMIARATPFQFAPGCRIVTCSAEDLIVLKAFAGRPKDWMDIDGVFARQGPKKLNRKLIFDSLAPLLEVKEDSDALPRLEAFFARG